MKRIASASEKVVRRGFTVRAVCYAETLVKVARRGKRTSAAGRGNVKSMTNRRHVLGVASHVPRPSGISLVRREKEQQAGARASERASDYYSRGRNTYDSIRAIKINRRHLRATRCSFGRGLFSSRARARLASPPQLRMINNCRSPRPQELRISNRCIIPGARANHWRLSSSCGSQ